MNSYLVYEYTRRTGEVRSFEVQAADSKWDAIQQAEAFARQRHKPILRRASRLPALYPQPIVVRRSNG